MESNEFLQMSENSHGGAFSDIGLADTLASSSVNYAMGFS